MRKVFSTLLFVLIGLLTLSACSNKKSETGSSPVSSVGGALLPSIMPFEGVLTMNTTIPEAGSTETKLYIAKEGVRTESTSHMKNMPSDLQMVMVSPAETPNLMYLINTSQKTYSVIDIDAIKKEAKEAAKAGHVDGYNDAKIENLGKETVNGYNCTHVRVTHGESVMEMWVSKEILDYFTYARMQSAKEKDMPDLAKRMRAAGLDGFPVKIWHKKANIVTELAKVEKHGLEASLFKVPAGYTKTEFPFMPSGISPNQNKDLHAMMKKMQEEMKNRQK
ncbi:MAG: DUF4412 domain-containing protein [Chlorobiaceae bacterium]|nr:DUF4412 domain-containing protein [Chlorobiaceae bacterium]